MCLSAALAMAAFANEGATVTQRRLLLDGALAGEAIVAVGERGAILRSSDHARTWQACASSTRATLTAVSFATETTGWAVGHDALILGTRDGGRTWSQQFQGENIQDSFLDVLALDASRVLAVGAYGLCVASADGGNTWARRKVLAEDNHLNRLTRGPGGTLYLAGERGTLLRSNDAGVTWRPLRVGYEGSFYGVLPLDRTRLLAHGIGGKLFHSADDGATWEAVPTPAPTLVAAAVKTRSGEIIAGGQARGLMISRDDGRTFSAFPRLVSAISELLELGDGAVLALGEDGAVTLSVTPK